MKKIFLALFILMFSCVFANEDTVKAGIKYNEVNARIEAFKDIQTKIEKDFYRDYLKDKNYKENMDLIDKKIFIVDNNRTICPFYLRKSLLSYAVVYVEKPDSAFYYNVLGNLIKFDVVENKSYPRRTFGYSRYGNLISVAFEIDKNEQFIYDKNGKLIAHWTDEKMVDEKSKFFKITRMVVE